MASSNKSDAPAIVEEAAIPTVHEPAGSILAEDRRATVTLPLDVGAVDHTVLVPAATGRVVVSRSDAELRLATSLAIIRHDGIAYGVGEKVPVDLVSYTKLLEIGAVVEKPWVDLDLVI